MLSRDDHLNIEQLMGQLTLQEKALLCSGGTSWSTRAIPRLNIPEAVMTDGTYGVRYVRPGEACIDDVEAMAVTELNLESDSEQLKKYYPATCFPSPSAFACSWDRDLVGEVARCIAQECRALSVDMLLAPAINIRRDPRGGRSFEYYSEDPFLTAELGAAFVDGLQNAGVGACLKHFACNNSEHRRTLMDSVVDERALQEIYLYAYHRIIERSGPWAVMSSYNRLNGVSASENPFLLDETLRRQWQFDGMVVSDWGGIKERTAALKAGCDLEMPRNDRFCREIEQAVEDGSLPLTVLDQAVRRILQFVDRALQGRKLATTCTAEDAHRLAIRTAEESCVLVKNEGGLLPLEPGRYRNILVAGEIALTPRYQGGGCAVINPTFLDIPLEQVRRCAGSGCEVQFAQGYTGSDETSDQLLADLREKASAADVVLLFAGLKIKDDTEGFDRDKLCLEPSHIAAIRCAAAVNQRVVVILSNGEAVTVEEFIDEVPAVLESFFSGQGGATAIANILFGKANPSGKLTTTFPRREQDLPAYPTFPGEYERQIYSEGIFVGYRYYDLRGCQPRFSFGFGLSYTTFSYDAISLQVDDSGDEPLLNVQVHVTNTGGYSGKEIVQAYVKAPGADYQMPEKALRGFAKLFLEPGESKTAVIRIAVRDACSHYDPELGEFVLEPGDYRILCGTSSRDLPLQARFRVKSGKQHKLFRTDSLHKDVFAQPAARAIYLDYLQRIGVIHSGEDTQAAETSLANMFWGLHRALLALSLADEAIRVERDELQSVVDEMNRACQAQAQQEMQIECL